jgi:murein DD-endopeptidase MepM/ murein hydrolase activator NlpD
VKPNSIGACLPLVLLTTVLAILIANASSPARAATSQPKGTIDNPNDAEFFQLTFPVSTKPSWTSNVVYKSIVDHTPPFYDATTDTKIEAYTGESVNGPIAGDCGYTLQGRYYCYNGHSGLDIPVATGTHVYAAHAGYVTLSQLDPNPRSPCHGYGIEILIRDVDNPQYFTRYGHLSSTNWKIPVHVYVARGQLIGYSDNTGCSTGAHLHFGLYYNQVIESAGYVLDPYGWFSQLPNPLGAPVTDYKWASGYPPDGNSNEPENWNLGALTGNDYVTKGRTHHGANSVGVAPSPTPDPIEHWWANNYGSAGAPYNPVTNGCQDFEGGTYCRNGTYYYPFQDVLISFWAHRYIGWSHVEGIIDGYPCGQRPNEPCLPPYRAYFRPTEFVSRQQFTKMVYIGLSLTQNLAGAPHFTDVLPGSTFYTYIETLYNMGIIAGYPCGGPGEPCDPQHRPYFRPGNNVTRGQASQIVELTAQNKGWLSGYGSGGGPDFWDVPVGQTFYNYIETLYNAGAVQYRVEEPGRGGQGGHYYIGWAATRAEIAMYIHELVYAVSPP